MNRACGSNNISDNDLPPLSCHQIHKHGGIIIIVDLMLHSANASITLTSVIINLFYAVK